METVVGHYLLEFLSQRTFLFRDQPVERLAQYFSEESLTLQKLYPNRPIFMSHQPEEDLDTLYIVYAGGPVIARSAPLDRVICLIYEGGSFGEQDLPFSYGPAWTAFPTLFEPYKSTTVLKIALTALMQMYREVPQFQARYEEVFRLRCQFNYHLLNIGPYPPQAVAALLRAVIYQERFLGFQPHSAHGQEYYELDLPSDLISRACQLNQRTVEQVLEGMRAQKLLAPPQLDDSDLIRVIDPEALKEVYGATRHKVSWWPLRK
ncbi:cyclic nucleotide-binding domain-containing protein [Anthocerotibacter panamensis]|uniref:hypothetical protein n=1 Tax=Anthocerotibacter panamensis TaxID=2857077 RepID=UPI001C408569|nr:hypothetical protein [Anthocerotibacter panamensis]